MEFDPSEDDKEFITVVGLNYAYITKLISGGSYAWAHSIEGDSGVQCLHAESQAKVCAFV